MTTDRDFLLLALDGIAARIAAIEQQVEAIRQAADGLNSPPKPRRPRKADDDAQEPAPPRKRSSYSWTPAQREAQAARARALWKKGTFGPRRKGSTAHAWTPEQRAKLSVAMKKVAVRKAAERRKGGSATVKNS